MVGSGLRATRQRGHGTSPTVEAFFGRRTEQPRFWADQAEAGARLKKMLEMGASRPWPDALTGQRELDVTGTIDYFSPLKKWLDEQNKGRVTGWK